MKEWLKRKREMEDGKEESEEENYIVKKGKK